MCPTTTSMLSSPCEDPADTVSIVSVQTNSIILQSKYRDSPKAQAPMGAKTGAPLANKPARSPKSKSGGGAAGWFLFILKVSRASVYGFTAVVGVLRSIAAADFPAHRCRSFHRIRSRCRGEF